MWCRTATAPLGKLAKLFREGRGDVVAPSNPVEDDRAQDAAVKALFAEVPFRTGASAGVRAAQVVPVKEAEPAVPVKAAVQPKLETASDFIKKLQPVSAHGMALFAS